MTGLGVLGICTVVHRGIRYCRYGTGYRRGSVCTEVSPILGFTPSDRTLLYVREQLSVGGASVHTTYINTCYTLD